MYDQTQELADAVAQSLGYGCIDRELLVQACLQYGISEAKLASIVDREPSWWATFAQNHAPYRTALQAAFCELATGQGLVYHGHLGHELVPKFRHVIKVLLTAPIDYRVAQVRERQGLEEVPARRYVEEVDKARTRRLMALSGKDWRDPHCYDLAVNLAWATFETAHDLIVRLARSAPYQPTEDSKQGFQDFALASQIRARLLLSGEFSHTHLEIHAHSGVVSVTGTIPDWMAESHIIGEIRQIAGVSDAQSRLTMVNSVADSEAI